MANVFVNEDSLSDIADAIRSKLNVQATYKPGEMAAAIESISGGGSTINNQNKTVHPSSSQQSITADSGYTGLGTVTVKGVTVENLSAANIVSGVTVKIGDADDDDRIASVTGSASGGITPTGTKTITSNGTGIDVYSYASADVSVPNSYSAGDEGKVVNNGALVAQTSDTVTENDTYDTTLINSLTVNVSGGGGGVTFASGTITPTENVNTLTFPVDFEPQYALIIANPWDMEADSTWKQAVVVYDAVEDWQGRISTRYLNGNYGNCDSSAASPVLCTYANGIFTVNRHGSSQFRANLTYKWFCWRETS